MRCSCQDRTSLIECESHLHQVSISFSSFTAVVEAAQQRQNHLLSTFVTSGDKEEQTPPPIESSPNLAAVSRSC